MPVALIIDINNYKEVYLDLAGLHISLLGDLSLQVIQENATTFEAFSVELVSSYSYLAMHPYNVHIPIANYHIAGKFGGGKV